MICLLRPAGAGLRRARGNRPSLIPALIRFRQGYSAINRAPLQLRVTLALRFSDGTLLAIENSGGVVEWFMAPVLKTGKAQAFVGSNPTPSAISAISSNPWLTLRFAFAVWRFETQFDRWGALRARVKSEALELEPKRSFG